MISGTQQKDNLLLLIEDNPFLKNLTLLFNSDDSNMKNVKEFLYMCIKLSNIENKYIYNDELIKRINSLFGQHYMLRDKYIEAELEKQIIKNEDAFKNLFEGYIKATSFDYGRLINLRNSLNSQNNIELFKELYKIFQIGLQEASLEKNIIKTMIYLVIHKEEKFKTIIEDIEGNLQNAAQNK
jgi:hypothetical protein